MSDNGSGGRRSSGDGYYGFSNPPGNGRNSSSSSAVPVWVILLIMLASGLFTLLFLWMCVQFMVRRRRARRAALDLERATEGERAWEAERETARLNASALGSKDEEHSDATRCDAGVELTYVVMAGEEQPSFLARPLKTSSPEDLEPPSPEHPPPSPKKGDAQALSNPNKSSPA